MNRRKMSMAAAVAAALGVAATVAIAQPASAATSDCPNVTGHICLWDQGSWGGLPFITVVGGTHPVWSDVTDNITSSGLSRKTGSYSWVGLNQLNVAVSETVATFPYNVAVSLLQTYGDNKIDDLFL